MNRTATVSEPEAAAPCRAVQPKVLAIDDDPELLRTLQLRFSNYELRMIAAYHGMHGIWLAATEKPDLIITDVRMPQGEGGYVIECLKQRAETASIPVIVLTGRRDGDLPARMMRLGAAKVFHKPVAFDELLVETAKHIELRRRD
jgi:two-component system, OmpR family, response regulator RpaA